MEETKWLKPSVSVSRIGDSASVQAVTRVPAAAKAALMPDHEHQSRETIYGGSIMGAEIRARDARKAAQQAAREADRAEAEAWSIRMEGYGGPAKPSPTIGQCLHGGHMIKLTTEREITPYRWIHPSEER